MRPVWRKCPIDEGIDAPTHPRIGEPTLRLNGLHLASDDTIEARPRFCHELEPMTNDRFEIVGHEPFRQLDRVGKGAPYGWDGGWIDYLELEITHVPSF